MLEWGSPTMILSYASLVFGAGGIVTMISVFGREIKCTKNKIEKIEEELKKKTDKTDSQRREDKIDALGLKIDGVAAVGIANGAKLDVIIHSNGYGKQV